MFFERFRERFNEVIYLLYVGSILNERTREDRGEFKLVVKFLNLVIIGFNLNRRCIYFSMHLDVYFYRFDLSSIKLVEIQINIVELRFLEIRPWTGIIKVH